MGSSALQQIFDREIFDFIIANLFKGSAQDEAG